MTRTRPTPAPTAQAPASGRRAARNSRADQVEQRLAVPVIIAAAVSVPAVFLTIFGDGQTALVGRVLNWASLAVLTAEAALLFILTGDRITWLRRHKWTLTIAVVAVPAVIFALAPVQAMRLVLRLAQFVGALRILRANRIIKAGRVLARRLGLVGSWRYVPILIGSVVAAGLVAVILADETSTSRVWFEQLTGWAGVVPAVLAGAILAAATFIVLRYRRRGPDPTESTDRTDG